MAETYTLNPLAQKQYFISKSTTPPTTYNSSDTAVTLCRSLPYHSDLPGPKQAIGGGAHQLQPMQLDDVGSYHTAVRVATTLIIQLLQH